MDTTGDGTTSVTSYSDAVCTVSGLEVSFVGVGICSLTANVAEGHNYEAADGSPQILVIDRPSPPPRRSPTFRRTPSTGGFTARVDTTGDGTTS